jgi:hypothetical protein
MKSLRYGATHLSARISPTDQDLEKISELIRTVRVTRLNR